MAADGCETVPLVWTALRAALMVPWLCWLCASDLRRRILPNVATFGGLCVGLCVQAGFRGLPGLADGLLAALAAGGVFLVPFLAGAAGAGDLKMAAAAAAFLGLKETPFFLVASSVAGLVVMVAMIAAKQASPARLRHFFRCAFDWRYDRAAGRAALPPKDDESGRIPYGLALAAGAAATLALEVA